MAFEEQRVGQCGSMQHGRQLLQWNLWAKIVQAYHYSNPFGAFDVMEEKVKLAWYVEKEWGIVVGGASSTQERKYFSLEETKYQVLCCCCHFSSYMEKTPRNWNNASKEPFTGKKNTEVKAIPMTQFKHKHLRGQLPSFHVYLLYTQPLSLQKHKGERADSHL